MTFETELQKLLKKDIAKSTNAEIYTALLTLVKNKAEAKVSNKGKKKLYYISAEFLIGKLMSNNLINLGLRDEADKVLAKHGKSLAEIEELEAEPSLGNGGLGRLAACFLDSLATLGLNGDGVGLNYHFGLFKQVFENHLQMATPNPWINDDCWLTKTDKTYTVHFAGFDVTSRMYDIDVIGYNNRTTKLHLFDIETIDETIVEEGGIDFDKEAIEKNLTLFLYPDDSDDNGRILRVYQQYFMVSNAAKLILAEAAAKGCTLHDLADYAVVQINDTHPSMFIPEMIRLLMEEGILMDEAISIVSKMCAYTNHTILAEALEKWPMHFMIRAVPQLMPIIRELDNRVRAAVKDESTYIIKDGLVHMAHMDIHYGFSVNGVAAIHTDILKETELNNFYKLYPEKFNNKTNGITFRRWLLSCNHELSSLLTETIGDGYKKDADELEKLLAYENDEAILDRIYAIKKDKKQALADYVKENEGIDLNPEGIFDIQIKRLHEYKRQQMNALYIIHKYLEIKGGKKPVRPLQFIFGAKAAPAYIIAQDIIHLLLVLSEIINNDPEVSPYMKVVMVENYNVSYAEKLIPACDISEQISLASKEASGTGNMKFMLNGAVTLGTDDGANVEIHELVGDDNIYIFGQDSDTVIEHYAKADYVSKDYYKASPVIKEAVDFIVGKQAMKVGNKENLTRLYNELLNKDWFMTLLDLEDYIKVKDQAFADFEDTAKWKKMMLHNIAKAGFFSSDRTIAEYNRDIWKLEQ